MIPEREIERQLDIFYGDVSQNLAQIYARLPKTEEMANFQLVGTVNGPHCETSRTLPSTVPFRDCGPGQTVLYRATMPDPCFWSPDVPALYRVTLGFRHSADGELHPLTVREIGIRKLGTSQRNFIWEGKRWVLRGVAEESVHAATLAEWRETNSTLIQTEPNYELCDSATRQGALIVVRTAKCGAELITELRLLATRAAVAMVIVESVEVPKHLKHSAPNLIFAQPIALDRQEPLAAWADVAWVDVTGATTEQFDLLRNFSIPVVIQRRLEKPLPLADARAECDHLQSDMVPYGDFAGYVV